MTKLEQAQEMLTMFQISNRLGEEAQDALLEARSNLTVETMQEAHRKLSEWQLVRDELKERLNNWEMN
jgi:hypothetical protein